MYQSEFEKNAAAQEYINGFKKIAELTPEQAQQWVDYGPMAIPAGALAGAGIGGTAGMLVGLTLPQKNWLEQVSQAAALSGLGMAAGGGIGALAGYGLYRYMPNKPSDMMAYQVPEATQKTASAEEYIDGFLKIAATDIAPNVDQKVVAAGINPGPVDVRVTNMYPGYAANDEGLFDWWGRLPYRHPFGYAGIKGTMWGIPGAGLGYAIGRGRGALAGGLALGGIGATANLIDAFAKKWRRAQLRAQTGEYV